MILLSNEFISFLMVIGNVVLALLITSSGSNPDATIFVRV
nr:MAG TPA: hypothetical protein [Caudoviricetes sp.]